MVYCRLKIYISILIKQKIQAENDNITFQQLSAEASVILSSYYPVTFHIQYISKLSLQAQTWKHNQNQAMLHSVNC